MTIVALLAGVTLAQVPTEGITLAFVGQMREERPQAFENAKAAGEYVRKKLPAATLAHASRKRLFYPKGDGGLGAPEAIGPNWVPSGDGVVYTPGAYEMVLRAGEYAFYVVFDLEEGEDGIPYLDLLRQVEAASAMATPSKGASAVGFPPVNKRAGLFKRIKTARKITVHPSRLYSLMGPSKTFFEGDYVALLQRTHRFAGNDRDGAYLSSRHANRFRASGVAGAPQDLTIRPGDIVDLELPEPGEEPVGPTGEAQVFPAAAHLDRFEVRSASNPDASQFTVFGLGFVEQGGNSAFVGSISIGNPLFRGGRQTSTRQDQLVRALEGAVVPNDELMLRVEKDGEGKPRCELLPSTYFASSTWIGPDLKLSEFERTDGKGASPTEVDQYLGVSFGTLPLRLSWVVFDGAHIAAWLGGDQIQKGGFDRAWKSLKEANKGGSPEENRSDLPRYPKPNSRIYVYPHLLRAVDGVALTGRDSVIRVTASQAQVVQGFKNLDALARKQTKPGHLIWVGEESDAN